MTSSQDIDTLIADKAQHDEAFRAELIKSPREAIAKFFGMEIPADLSINVVEDTESILNIVLPPVTAELTQEQLTAVAGGKGTGPLAGCKGCTTGSLGKRIIYTNTNQQISPEGLSQKGPF